MDFFSYFTNDSKDSKKTNSKKESVSKKSDKKKKDSQCGG